MVKPRPTPQPKSSSRPAWSRAPLPGLPFNGKTVIGSREAMILEPQPKSMVIIGAGAIGVEFAYFYNAFGTKVTLVEMLPNVLPVEDTEVSQTLERALTKQGIKILTNTKTTKTETTREGRPGRGGRQIVGNHRGRVCLVAIGVVPLLPGGKLKLELTERGYIKTDDRYETSAQGVYAAGDIIGPPWLAHVASWEAIQAVEGMFDQIRAAKDSELSRLHLLPAAGREHRPHGTRREGIGQEIPGRKISLQRQRQSPRHRRDRWLREVDHRRTARRNSWRPHHRPGSDGDDRRARPGDDARSDLRGDRGDDPRASDPERIRPRSSGPGFRPRHPHLSCARRIAARIGGYFRLPTITSTIPPAIAKPLRGPAEVASCVLQ